MNFEAWLISIGKSPATAKDYAGAIAGGLSNWAAKAGLVKNSLGEIREPGSFRMLAANIRQLAIYDARNTRARGMYNAALNSYADYLADVTQNELEQDLRQILEDRALSDAEKASWVNTRIGQGPFRQRLIKYWGGCALTGYRDTRILVAPHIKPWSKANELERLDVFNGLLLLPNLGKVFELGYISFESSGTICISGELESASALGVHEQLNVDLDAGHHGYVEYHRRQVFRR